MRALPLRVSSRCRLGLRALPVLLLLTAACAPPPPADEPQTAGADAVDARATMAMTPVASPPVLGKRAAPRPGEQISPLIALRGRGADWAIRIENAGGYRHTVELDWAAAGNQHARGALQYQPAASGEARASIVLSGGLAMPDGDRAVRVQIDAGACSDGSAQAYTQRVRVEVEGRPPLDGCGDLAT